MSEQKPAYVITSNVPESAGYVHVEPLPCPDCTELRAKLEAAEAREAELRRVLKSLLGLFKNSYSPWTGAFQGYEIEVITGPSGLDGPPRGIYRIPWDKKCLIEQARSALARPAAEEEG